MTRLNKIKVYNHMLFLCNIILWAKLSSIILMWNLQSTFYDIIIALQFLIKYVRTASDFCCQTSLHCNLVVTVGAQYIDETVRPLLLFSLGTVDSYLAGLDWNQVSSASCSALTAHAPVKTSSAKQKTGARSLLS